MKIRTGTVKPAGSVHDICHSDLPVNGCSLCGRFKKPSMRPDLWRRLCRHCLFLCRLHLPVEGLPQAIQALAQLFPFTHYMTFFTNRAIRGVPIQLTLSSLMGLGAYLILFLATFPLFITRLKKGNYEKDI